MFSRFLDLNRVYDYYDKLESLMFCSLLISVISGNFNIGGLWHLLISSLSTYAFTFTLNSLTDITEDFQAGKDRFFGFSKNTLILVCVSWFTASLLLVITSSLTSGILSGLALGIGTFYSLKPLRFKVTPFGPLISFLPPLLLLSYSLHLNSFLSIYLSAWLLLISWEKLSKHYLRDFQEDKKSKTYTLAVLLGYRQMERIKNMMGAIKNAYSFLALIFFNPPSSMVILITTLLFRFRSGPYK